MIATSPAARTHFIDRHAVATYFVLAYSITWFILLGLFGLNLATNTALSLADMGVMFLAMLAGPSIAGLLLTAVLDGRAGLQELWARFLKWRLPLRWVAVAVLTVPVTALAVLTTLAVLVAPQFAPGFAPAAFAIGLVAGLVEEIGWTGFALPRLQRRMHPLAAALTLGLFWALWHALADLIGNVHTMGWLWPLNFVLFWLLPLTAYRLLMVWVYNHTRSLSLMQLMHACYTGTLLVLSPAVAFPQTLVWQGLFAAMLCIFALAVVLATRGRLGSHLLPASHTLSAASAAPQVIG